MTAGDRKKGEAALIAALAGGASVFAAATTAGISEATAHRRLRESDFRRRVDDARAELLGQAMARLSAAATAAATTLVQLLEADAPPAVRLGAARSILDSALRWREMAELSHRLDALEEWVEATKDDPEAGRAQRWRRPA